MGGIDESEGGEDIVHADLIHTAEINGAYAQETGGTGHVTADDVHGGSDGTGEARFSGAEDSGSAASVKRGHVHGPAVIAQDAGGMAQPGQEFPEGGLTGQVAVGHLQVAGDIGADREIGFRAQEDDFPVILAGQGAGGLSKALGRPAFGRAVFRTRADGQPRGGRGHRPGQGASDGWKREQTTAGRFWQAIGDVSGQVQSIQSLVTDSAATIVAGDDIGEQPAAAVTGKANAARDAGHSDFQGGAE